MDPLELENLNTLLEHDVGVSEVLEMVNLRPFVQSISENQRAGQRV